MANETCAPPNLHPLDRHPINCITLPLADSHHRHDDILVADLVDEPIPRAAKLELVAVVHAAQAVALDFPRFQTARQLVLELPSDIWIKLFPLTHGARQEDQPTTR